MNHTEGEEKYWISLRMVALQCKKYCGLLWTECFRDFPAIVVSCSGCAHNYISPSSSIERLFNLLPKVLHKRGLQEHAQSALLLHRTQHWLVARLPVLEPCIHVRHIKDGVLTIGCDHGIALQECQASLADLREYLKIECPFVRVQEIRFVRT